MVASIAEVASDEMYCQVLKHLFSANIQFTYVFIFHLSLRLIFLSPKKLILSSALIYEDLQIVAVLSFHYPNT